MLYKNNIVLTYWGMALPLLFVCVWYYGDYIGYFILLRFYHKKKMVLLSLRVWSGLASIGINGRYLLGANCKLFVLEKNLISKSVQLQINVYWGYIIQKKNGRYVVYLEQIVIILLYIGDI